MSPVRLDFPFDPSVARVTLACAKGNILDKTTVLALDGIFESLSDRRDLRAVVLCSEGPHFSFGASIEEHLPREIDAALGRLGCLLRRIAQTPAPTIAAVRGQCLGGGLELVLACDLVIAEETALLGLPEIRLGVFPPAGCALLPVRVGAARAAEMILTGRSRRAREAYETGLVTRLAPAGQLEEELWLWIREYFLPRAPSALRYAARALRRDVVRALDEVLADLDRMYLEEMMPEGDAEEGIRSFLERREARWSRNEVMV
jgi:cyclohexa-1,5-dienecarbonyl-CoA hydratase